MASRYDIIEQMIPNQNSLNILDYGCGTGHFMKRLEKQGHNIIGVDLDTDLKIEDIKDSSIDVVLSICVLEHTKNPGLYLNNINRVMQDDGFLIICVPNGITFNSFFSQLFITKKRLSKIKCRGPVYDHIVNWDAVSFNKLLNTMGFEYISHKFQGGMPFGKIKIPFLGCYTMIFKFKKKRNKGV